jgi:hypothetical protein
MLGWQVVAQLGQIGYQIDHLPCGVRHSAHASPTDRAGCNPFRQGAQPQVDSLRFAGRAGPEAFGLWRSLVARVVRDDEAAGSNPVSPTKRAPYRPHSNRRFLVSRRCGCRAAGVITLRLLSCRGDPDPRWVHRCAPSGSCATASSRGRSSRCRWGLPAVGRRHPASGRGPR